MRAERPLRFPPSSVVARGWWWVGGITHKGEGGTCDAALRQAPVQARVRALYRRRTSCSRRVVSQQPARARAVREGGFSHTPSRDARRVCRHRVEAWPHSVHTRLERRASSRSA